MATFEPQPDTPADQRPLLVYDGQCGFCRCNVAKWRRNFGDAITFEPYQEVADRFPKIGREAFATAAHLIEPGGRVSRGAEAVYRAMAIGGKRRWVLWAYEHVPGAAWASETGYRFVADHRNLMARLFPCAEDASDDPCGMNLTRWVFLRGLGVIYLMAFASLWPQIIGLVGSKGILPAHDMLQQAGARLGPERFWEWPTLGWWDSSDAFLRFLCGGGMGLACLLIFDVAPAMTLALLWVFYLSLVNVGGVFLQFQWDALLLETGLLAVFLAPLYIVPRFGRAPPPPSRIVVWLFRWLLFRLMFLSGLVKLMSGDETWRNLTALTAHYETQPLTNWVAWHFAQAPLWFQRLSCGVMFAIELALPFFIFFGRRMRQIAFWGIGFLLVMIIITGNYGFFNLLSIVLCIMLLDDGFWPRRIRLRFSKRGERRAWRWPGWVMAPIGVAVIVLTLYPALRRLQFNFPWPRPVVETYRTTAPFDSFNAYGLFAAMTHSRPEIIIEGSDDGRTWLPYEFKYKPGDVMHPPPFVQPHMPRLDWQMWFAALGSVNRDPWFVHFVRRLLQGSPDALGLLAKNPFPDRPPQLVRAMLYDYHFTDSATRAATGAWWRRELRGMYCPPLSLDAFRRADKRAGATNR